MPGHNFIDLLTQLMLGYPCNRPLYFMLILALLSLMVWGAMRLSATKANVLLLLLVVVCFGLQYSGVNKNLCCIFTEDISYVIGRIVELAPYAVLGCFIRELELNSPVKIMRSLAFFSFAFGLLLYIPFAVRNPAGFGYAGLNLFFVVAGFVMFLVTLRLRVRVNEDLFRVLGNCSILIYFTHILVGHLLKSCAGLQQGYSMALAVFSLSTGLALLLMRIPLVRKVAM